MLVANCTAIDCKELVAKRTVTVHAYAMPPPQHTEPEGLNFERVQIVGPICKKRTLIYGLLWCNLGPLELTRQIDYAIIKQHDRVRREALMPPFI